MLRNSQAVKIKNIRRQDLIVNNVQNRFEEADALFRSLLAAGYVIYDVVANSGFAALDSVSVGKYVCVWVNGDPSVSSYALTTNNVTRHTDVIIIGIRINSAYNIINHTLSYSIDNGGAANYNNKLRVHYSSITIKSNVVGFAGFSYCNFSVYNTAIDINELTTIDNCNISIGGNARYLLTMTNGTAVTITNSNINAEIECNYSYGKLKLINCKFVYTSGIYGLNPGYIDIEFNNVYVDNNGTLALGRTTCNTSYNILNAHYTANVAGVITSINILRKNNFLTYNRYTQLAISYLTSTTGFITKLARYAHQRSSFRGYGGIIKRNFYSVGHEPHYRVDDDLKYNDDDDLELAWRERLETEVAAALIAKIKNFTFYKSDGTTAVTTYRNNESFLIYATRDGQSDYGIFAWHKGQLYPTIYSEVWPDQLYTIVRVFQIWEYPEEVVMSNTFDIDDSPIEATYLMQDMTSKVIRV